MPSRKPAGKPSRSKQRRTGGGRRPSRGPSAATPAAPAKRIGTVAAPRGISERASAFPVPENLWCRFFDDRLPYWVKSRYQPPHARTEGAFNDKDAAFFGPAIV